MPQESDSYNSTRFFPVKHSLLSPNALLQHVSARYGLRLESGQLIQKGMNDTYLLKSREAKYALRVYRYSRQCRSHIRFEMGLLNHLALHGVSVATPLLDRTGELFHEVPAPEGNRYVAVFNYAAGTPLILDRHQSERYGRALASLHCAADSFNPSDFHETFAVEELLVKPLHNISPFLEHRPEDFEYLRSLSEDLKECLNHLPRSCPAYGIIHGDHLYNVHVSGDGLFTFFDFDNSAYGWRVLDLALFNWVLAFKIPTWFIKYVEDDETLWSGFLSGYSSIRPPEPWELGVIPLFVLARTLWDMGVHTGVADEFGGWWLRDPYFDERLELLKTWISDLGGMEKLRRRVLS
jgi:Ser/Thr protein kinase RdoA (MazF antagonist)